MKQNHSDYEYERLQVLYTQISIESDNIKLYRIFSSSANLPR
jgi:hypothetical protein